MQVSEMAENAESTATDVIIENNIGKRNEEIKSEVVVQVKGEPHDCLVCGACSADVCDVTAATADGRGSVQDFLCRFTSADLAAAANTLKHICRNCFDLVNVLILAEIEYLKVKRAFEDVISKNPLFIIPNPMDVGAVKAEQYSHAADDSEDEPLAITKKKRTRAVTKKVKKTENVATKKKTQSKNSNRHQVANDGWTCELCGVQGAGGATGKATHELTHVKTEQIDKDSTENQNGIMTLKCEFESEEDFDDDDDFLPNNFSDEEQNKASSTRTKKKVIVKRKYKTKKDKYNCDQCSAIYTSIARLERHRETHSKQPFICEVCGAKYKHKRACDIHVALHKGISDWKCEECNKLFPSKGALQRHNNIHTGKSNYQCDLCGKSFIHTSSFKMHKLSHSGVKPHACDVCGLALMTRSHLKRHKRIHSGEKRHQCGVCGKRFSERYNLIAHSKSHEAELDPAVDTTKRYLFRCSYCTERFERRYMLERHMVVIHNRTLERAPPTPRNTMSKLLKQQAQARRPEHLEVETKNERSPEPQTTPAAPQKLMEQLTSASAWAGACAPPFAARHDFN